MNGPEVTWLKEGFEIPQRTSEGDAQVWEVWADVRGTSWERRNRFPYALVEHGHGEHQVYNMAQRLYAIYGASIPLGVRRVG